ncbi:MAG: rRNA maturation RNase YbeY [Limisphaerales bacterium]
MRLRNRHPRQRVNLVRLRQLARAALECPPLKMPGPAETAYELGVVLVGAREMAVLNQTYLGHSGSTDVITFDYGDPVRAPDGASPLRGDLFICLDDARRQARQFGSTWQEELVRYVVHGFLHLRGYDDHEATARRLMKREENRLVRHLRERFPLRGIASAPKIRA